MNDYLLDLTALDVGEYFTYVDTIEQDQYYGWPSIANWYTYRKHYIYEITN